MKRSTWEITRAAPTLANSLFIVGLEVVDIEDAEFEGTDYEACGIDAALSLWEELLDEFVLALLKTLHTKGHASQIGDLLLGIAKGEVTEETLVVLVDLVVDEGFLLHKLTTNGGLETLDNLFEDGFVEHEFLAIHHGRDIATREQLARLEDDTIGTCIEHIDPELFVEDLAREDEHLDIGMEFLGVAANLDAHRGGASKAQVEQHEVGLLLFEQSPVGWFVFGRSYHFCFRNIAPDDSQSAFKFEGHILDNNYFKFIHIYDLRFTIYDLLFTIYDLLFTIYDFF